MNDGDPFSAVDAARDPWSLVRTLDRMSDVGAVRELRARAFEFLDTGEGMVAADVGCGLGDCARFFATRVGRSGISIGIDKSRFMISEARKRAAAKPSRPRFLVGDAKRLPIRTAQVDVCAIERTLQHLGDPLLALTELGRALRPGGRLAAIDTDWGSLSISHPDEVRTRALVGYVADHYVQSGRAGRDLPALFRQAGLLLDDVEEASLVLTDYDPLGPDTGVAPPFEDILDQAVRHGIMSSDSARSWFGELVEAGKRPGSFLRVTMCAALGRRSP